MPAVPRANEMATQTEYVRPKRPPAKRERPTIGRLLAATFVFAVSFSCFVALRPFHPLLANWMIASLVCGAIGLAFRGHEGFWVGLGFGALAIPVLLFALWFVSALCYLLYMSLTGQRVGGLGS